jgi:hypothetical protein
MTQIPPTPNPVAMPHRLLLLLAALLPLAACAHDVRVVDRAGRPIPDAEVTSVSLSMDIGPNRTNRDGDADVPGNIQGTRWIAVAHPGYQSRSVDVPPAYPLTIVLSSEQDLADDLRAAIPPGTTRADALARLRARGFQTADNDHAVTGRTTIAATLTTVHEFRCRIPITEDGLTGPLTTSAETIAHDIGGFGGPITATATAPAPASASTSSSAP